MSEVAREAAVDALRRAGFADAAAEVASGLPDPVDLDTLTKFVAPFGIRSINDVIDALGGSP